MPYRNWLLPAVVAAEPEIAPLLHHVSLTRGESLIPAGTAPTNFWFLERGFLSVLLPMSNGMSVEVDYIGDRGIVTVQSLLTEEPLELDFIVQRHTEAYRLPIAPLRAVIYRHADLRRRLRAVTVVSLRMRELTVACHQVCSEEQRIARRLLTMTTDGAAIEMSENFLAEMIPVKRQSVSKAYMDWKRAGLIQHRYGKVQVLDRAGLERRACEHYEAIEERRRRLLNSYEK